MKDILQTLFPFYNNPNDDLGIREHNQRMYDKREAYRLGAIEFSKYIKENYSIIKGGKYRHRGDTAKNSKPKTEEDVYNTFISA